MILRKEGTQLPKEWTNQCSRCQWYDKCYSETPCRYFDTLDIDDEDDEVYEAVRSEFDEYAEVWFEYIEQYE